MSFLVINKIKLWDNRNKSNVRPGHHRVRFIYKATQIQLKQNKFTERKMISALTGPLSMLCINPFEMESLFRKVNTIERKELYEVNMRKIELSYFQNFDKGCEIRQTKLFDIT